MCFIKESIDLWDLIYNVIVYLFVSKRRLH